MPFGLRNAPSTFQRLMDQFRNGLPNVNILVYLDDIVVLSETFEQHIDDLRMVFDRLKKFKLCVIREKYIARPLSNLSKKSTAWKWSEIEQKAFQTLKQCLIIPPILRQVDPKKPFIIRTDASSYALGAVLLQGESLADEQPVDQCFSNWKCNFIAEMLSCLESRDEEICELETIIMDFPTRTANELRTEQLKDLELKKIIGCLENPNKGFDFANWTGRGYVMNKGVLYRYSPHAEVEEAQLVVPTHEREKILKLHHDAPTAAHYGADGTFSRISSKYYWTGMRKFIADYVKSCSKCIRYKATNQKPAGLLQTPVPAQRFESIDIDISVPYQKRPKASPVERKNRDLKSRLAMMAGNNHTLWTEKLPAIRFALNTSKCESTDHTAAYLTFARELRTLDQVNTDLQSVTPNDNFVPDLHPF
ncbi:retrovirus-related Pol polyprotein from transposon 412 [Trichonephila clavipes]|nr:retrovirus-related Pol polyprotein from transposon 412 [Trichonephila clavipes]